MSVVINEDLARRSKENMSFSDYKPMSATNEFNAEITRVSGLVESAKANVSEEAKDKLDRFLTSYKSRYASWINKSNSNGAKHVSVMISGASNYNMGAHEKYLSREKALWEEYEEFRHPEYKISAIVAGDRIIKSGDANAIDKLKQKLEAAIAEHAEYKEYNAKARKSGTQPHAPYVLQNSNGRIKGIKDRLAHLEKLAARGNKEIIVETKSPEAEGIKIVDNVEAARLQIFFNGKPSAEVRDGLKKNGFRWTPSIGAWQAYRSSHALRAAQAIIAGM